MRLIDRIRRRPAPLPCQQLVELVTDYLEDTLPPREQARLDAHLSACDACRMYIEQMREMLRVMGAIEAEQVSDAAYAELSGVFAAWKAERGV
jgi:predicted anti-sigma-YlaC factor YlaD